VAQIETKNGTIQTVFKPDAYQKMAYFEPESLAQITPIMLA